MLFKHSSSTQYSQKQPAISFGEVPFQSRSIQPDNETDSPLLSNQNHRPSFATDLTSNNGITPLQGQIGICRFAGPWSWELASHALAIGCIVLAIAILCYMDDKPQSHWRLGIAPNSLIAVFSTIAKSALLYPISECIGQLKWHYFEQAQAMRDMDEFDRASRGPWGATTFILRLGRRASFTALGALIVVLMLAFEPFTQQVISFSTRKVLVPNSGEFISRLENWYHVDQRSFQKFDWKFDYRMQRGAMDVVAGVKGTELLTPASNAYCPTTECHYNDYTSLAVCAQCDSQTLRLEHFTCTGNYSKGTDSAVDFLSSFSSYEELQETVSDIFETKNDYQYPPYTIGSMGAFWNKSSGLEYGSARSTPLCTASMRNEGSASSGSLVWPTISTFTCMAPTLFDNYLMFRSYKPGNIGGMNGTLSRCTLEYCLKTYEKNIYKDGHFQSSNITESKFNFASDEPSENNEDPWSHWSILTATGGQKKYRLGTWNAEKVQMSMREVFLFPSAAEVYLPHFVNETNGNFTRLFTGVADVISGVIQSPYNIDAQNVTGASYRTEVWVNVKWQWFIVPLILLVASIVFLMGTVLQTRKKAYIFKTALLPALLLGSTDIADGSIAIPREGKVVYRHLLGECRKRKIRLIEDIKRDLKLKVE